MSTWQKFRLMMHVKMCGLCRGFHKDVIKFQEIEHEFDECCEKFCDESLDSDCKDKIRQLMAEELAAAKTPEKQK